EDCAIPAMTAPIASAVLQVLDNAAQRDSLIGKLKLAFQFKLLPDLGNLFPTIPNTKDPNSFKTEAEMVQNIFFFNSMGQDDAAERFSWITIRFRSTGTRTSRSPIIQSFRRLNSCRSRLPRQWADGTCRPHCGRGWPIASLFASIRLAVAR